MTGPRASIAWWRPAARSLAFLAPAILVLLPFYAYLVRTDAPIARLVVEGLFLLAIAEPAIALLVCAALLPLGVPLATLLASPVTLTEPLCLAFLSGWLLRESLRPTNREPGASGALVGPLLLFGASVVASCLVQLAVVQLSLDFPWPYAKGVVRFITVEYFQDRHPFEAIAGAAQLLEGIGLFAATVRLSRADRELPWKAARMVVVGATAVAVLNISELAAVFVRLGGSWPSLWAGLAQIRISSAFWDVNAAGSFLAMSLLIAVGITVSAGRGRTWWILITLALAIGLVLTGSRAAFAATLVIAIIAVALWARRAPRRSLIWAGLACVVALGALVVAVALHSGASRSPGRALWTRVELAKAAIRMFATAPALGVGPGRFYMLSARFLSPEIRAIYPAENAHNNLLQVLAELGIAGFVTLAWFVIALARRLTAHLRGTLPNFTLIGIAAGLGAFAVTSFAGHPLVIREVALPFWLVTGLAVAATEAVTALPGEGEARGLRLARLAVVVGMAAIAVAVPLQARHARAEADLSGSAIGWSGQSTDARGLASRWMTSRAGFYVPDDACSVNFSLGGEATSWASASDVEILFNGRLANRVHVEPGRWSEVRLLTPPAAGRRFSTVEIRLAASLAASDPATPGASSVQRRINVSAVDFTKCRPDPIVVTALIADRGLPSPPGVPIRWRVVAKGGLGPIEYQFSARDPDGIWSVIRGYGPENAAAWTPVRPGAHAVRVLVRDSASPATREVALDSGPLTIGPAPLAVSRVSSDPAFPLAVGVPMTWSAMVSGGSAAPEFKFWLRAPDGWHVLRDYGPAPSLEWTPQTAGDYVLQVWVRNAGSTAYQEAWGTSGPFQVVPR